MEHARMAEELWMMFEWLWYLKCNPFYLGTNR